MDEVASGKVIELRQKFAEQYADNVNNGVYHENDLERVRTEDVYLNCFLLHRKYDVTHAAAMMDTCFKWRKEMGVNDLTEKYFPRWMHELGGVYYHNHTKEGHKILYFLINKNKKDPEKLPEVKKFIAWWIDKHQLKTPDQKLVVLFDMTGAGLSNMDIEQIKFIISCFTTYYPALLGYMLVYEMPWVLNALWKVIRQFLSADEQKAVLFVKRHEIQQYINKDQLWQHMGGEDAYQYSYLPKEDSGIDIANGELSSSDSMHSLVDAKQTTTPVRKRVTFADKKEPSPPPKLNTSRERRISAELVTGLGSNHNKCFKGKLCNINPAEKLVFKIQDPHGESKETLQITNTLKDKKLAYKIKTTSPDYYRVRPSCGVLKPGEVADVLIYLQLSAETTSSAPKDRFLLMLMEVDNEVTDPNAVNPLWRKIHNPHDHSSKYMYNYMEHRLSCELDDGKQSKAAVREQLASVRRELDELRSVLDTMKTEVRDVKRTNGQLQSSLKYMFFWMLVLMVFSITLAAYFFLGVSRDFSALFAGAGESASVETFVEGCTGPFTWGSAKPS